MRHIILTVIATCSLLWCANVQALELTVDAAMNVNAIVGRAGNGDTQSYRLRASSGGTTTFSMDGNTTLCGAQITQKSRSGQLKIIDRFPASFDDISAAGDVYIVSFYQNRTGLVSNQDCHFSFSVSQQSSQ